MPLSLFFSVFRCSDTGVFLELGKKGKMEEHGKLRLLSILRDFIHPWVCLVLMLPFCYYWGLKWFKELQANKKNSWLKQGFWHISYLYLEVLRVNTAGDMIIGWSGYHILLSVSEACQLYIFSKSSLSLIPATSSLFSIWILYLYFDCQFFCKYFQSNYFSQIRSVQ